MSNRHIKVIEVMQQVEQAMKQEESFVVEVPWENPKSFKEGMYEELKMRGWTDRVKVYAKEDMCYVLVKAVSYMQKLEAMVRKLAMNVDDEKLYEEAQELIGHI